MFKGGGSEVMLASLDERIRAATDAALISLFPRFKEADAAVSAWEAVIKRVATARIIPSSQSATPTPPSGTRSASR
ncbi:MAG: hypothetical protein HC888_11710 [Candidatus Competibacteraceae bacterium]|nr:hypothetical protein [Candidatus Competibacteraceae bacterium]